MASRSKRWRRSATAFLLTALVPLVSRLPLGVARALGRGLGSCAAHLPLEGTRRAESNLLRAFGDEHSLAGRRRLVRRMYRHFGETALESIVMHRWGPEKVLRRTSIRGLSEAVGRVDAGLERGKGVVLITGHIGQWDVFTCVGGHSWSPSAMITRPFKVRGYQKFVDRIRTGFGAPRQISQGDPIWAVAKVLRKNGVVGIAADQDTKRVPGTFVPFFGRPAYTPRAPAMLSITVGSPVVVFCIVKDGGHYRAVATGPIDPELVADADDPGHELTSIWTRALEDIIREYPDQWFWSHARWHTTPEVVERRTRQAKAVAATTRAVRECDSSGTER